jgi:hypothetical protein
MTRSPVLGQANDVNKQNFTIQDILGSSGSRRGSGGGPAAATNQSSPGVTTVWAGGANYRDTWGKNTDAYGSYFFNSQHVATYTQDTLDKQFTADSSNYRSLDIALPFKNRRIIASVSISNPVSTAPIR